MGAAVGKVVAIKDYRVKVKKLIAEGGFSHVFLVKDVKTGEEYAMKRMLVDEGERLDNAEAEIQVMENLPRSRYLLRLLAWDVRRTTDMYEVLMLLEYCSGGNLVQIIKNRWDRPFEEKELLKIFQAVCEAVAVLHSCSPPIFHRDLKIENVLFDPKHGYKLCDFGSCTTKMVQQVTSENRALIDDDIQRNTTPSYRAPEMVDLHSGFPITERGDIWALGCLLYRMAYRKDAFESTFAVTAGSLAFPARSDYSTEVERLIRFMLVRDPRKRPDIFAVLDRVSAITGLPVQTRRPTPPPAGSPATPSRPSRRISIRASVNLSGLDGPGGVLSQIDWDASAPLREAPTQPSRAFEAAMAAGVQEPAAAHGGAGAAAGRAPTAGDRSAPLPPRPKARAPPAPARSAPSGPSAGLLAALDWYGGSGGDGDGGDGGDGGGGGGVAAAAAPGDTEAAALAPGGSAAVFASGAAAAAAAAAASGESDLREVPPPGTGAGAAAASFSHRARQFATGALHRLTDALRFLVSAPVEKWVQKAVRPDPGPPKWKYVRRLVVYAWDAATALEAGMAAQGEVSLRLAAALARVPLLENDVVACKTALLLLRLATEGPPQTIAEILTLSSLLREVAETHRARPSARYPLIADAMEAVLAKCEFLERHPAFEGTYSLDTHLLRGGHLLGPQGALSPAVLSQLLALLDRALRLLQASLPLREDPMMPPLAVALVRESFNLLLISAFAMSKLMGRAVSSGGGEGLRSELSAAGQQLDTLAGTMRRLFEAVSNLTEVMQLYPVPVVPDLPDWAHATTPGDLSVRPPPSSVNPHTLRKKLRRAEPGDADPEGAYHEHEVSDMAPTVGESVYARAGLDSPLSLSASVPLARPLRTGGSAASGGSAEAAASAKDLQALPSDESGSDDGRDPHTPVHPRAYLAERAGAGSASDEEGAGRMGLLAGGGSGSAAGSADEPFDPFAALHGRAGGTGASAGAGSASADLFAAASSILAAGTESAGLVAAPSPPAAAAAAGGLSADPFGGSAFGAAFAPAPDPFATAAARPPQGTAPAVDPFGSAPFDPFGTAAAAAAGDPFATAFPAASAPATGGTAATTGVGLTAVPSPGPGGAAPSFSATFSSDFTFAMDALQPAPMAPAPAALPRSTSAVVMPPATGGAGSGGSGGSGPVRPAFIASAIRVVPAAPERRAAAPIALEPPPPVAPPKPRGPLSGTAAAAAEKPHKVLLGGSKPQSDTVHTVNPLAAARAQRDSARPSRPSSNPGDDSGEDTHLL